MAAEFANSEANKTVPFAGLIDPCKQNGEDDDRDARHGQQWPREPARVPDAQ